MRHMLAVSWSGERGREELLARPDMRPGRCGGRPGPSPLPGGGVQLSPLPLKYDRMPASEWDMERWGGGGWAGRRGGVFPEP